MHLFSKEHNEDIRFFQMLTNAQQQSTDVMLTLAVSIPMDHTTAPVNQDIREMGLTVQVR